MNFKVTRVKVFRNWGPVICSVRCVYVDVYVRGMCRLDLML